MGNKGSSILKRQRELKKAEKAAEKRERRQSEKGDRAEGPGPKVASYDDLEGYGMVGGDDDTDRKQPA